MGLSGGFLVDMHPKGVHICRYGVILQNRKGYFSIYSIWSIISLMVLRFRGSLAVS